MLSYTIISFNKKQPDDLILTAITQLRLQFLGWFQWESSTEFTYTYKLSSLFTLVIFLVTFYYFVIISSPLYFIYSSHSSLRFNFFILLPIQTVLENFRHAKTKPLSLPMIEHHKLLDMENNSYIIYLVITIVVVSSKNCSTSGTQLGLKYNSAIIRGDIKGLASNVLEEASMRMIKVPLQHPWASTNVYIS